MDRRKLIICLSIAALVAVLAPGTARAWGVAVGMSGSTSAATVETVYQWKEPYLSAYWSLDEASGLQREDSHGAYPLTDTGTVNATALKYVNGTVTAYDQSECLSTTDVGLIPAGGLAISFWVRFTTVDQGDFILAPYPSSHVPWFVKRYSSALQRYIQWRVQESDLGFPQLFSSQITAATWYHVVCAAADGYLWMAVNGVQVGSSGTMAWDGTFHTSIVNTLFSISQGNYPAVQGFSGNVDEIAFWNGITFAGTDDDTFPNFASTLYAAGAGHSYADVVERKILKADGTGAVLTAAGTRLMHAQTGFLALASGPGRVLLGQRAGRLTLADN